MVYLVLFYFLLIGIGDGTVMPLQTAMERRPGEMREGWLKGKQAIVERQQTVPTEGDDGLILQGQDSGHSMSRMCVLDSFFCQGQSARHAFAAIFARPLLVRLARVPHRTSLSLLSPRHLLASRTTDPEAWGSAVQRHRQPVPLRCLWAAGQRQSTSWQAITAPSARDYRPTGRSNWWPRRD